MTTPPNDVRLTARQLAEQQAWNEFEAASDNKLLEVRTVARLLRVSAKTLERYRHHGTGPAYLKLNNRRVFYRAGDVREYLSQFDSYHSTDQDPRIDRDKLAEAGRKGAAKRWDNWAKQQAAAKRKAKK